MRSSMSAPWPDQLTKQLADAEADLAAKQAARGPSKAALDRQANIVAAIEAQIQAERHDVLMAMIKDPLEKVFKSLCQSADDVRALMKILETPRSGAQSRRFIFRQGTPRTPMAICSTGSGC